VAPRRGRDLVVTRPGPRPLRAISNPRAAGVLLALLMLGVGAAVVLALLLGLVLLWIPVTLAIAVVILWSLLFRGR
jgi:hypothetical protein